MGDCRVECSVELLGRLHELACEPVPRATRTHEAATSRDHDPRFRVSATPRFPIPVVRGSARPRFVASWKREIVKPRTREVAEPVFPRNHHQLHYGEETARIQQVRPLQKRPYPPSTRLRVAPPLTTLSKYPDTTLSAASQWTRGLAGRASRGAALRPIMGDFFPWSGLTRGAGYLKRDNAGYGFPTLARVTARQRARLSVIIAGEETAALRAALVGWPVAVGLGAPAGFSAFDNKVPGRAGARAYACRDGVRGADGGPGGAGPAACGAVYSGGESVKRGVRIGGSWVVGREVASEATVARSRIGGSARSKSRRHASCNQR